MLWLTVNETQKQTESYPHIIETVDLTSNSINAGNNVCWRDGLRSYSLMAYMCMCFSTTQQQPTCGWVWLWACWLPSCGSTLCVWVWRQLSSAGTAAQGPSRHRPLVHALLRVHTTKACKPEPPLSAERERSCLLTPCFIMDNLHYEQRLHVCLTGVLSEFVTTDTHNTNMNSKFIWGTGILSGSRLQYIWSVHGWFNFSLALSVIPTARQSG